MPMVDLLVAAGIVLVLVGFAMILLALVLGWLRGATRGRGKTSGGVVVLLGPLPIVVSTGGGAIRTLVVLLTILIALISVVIILIGVT